MRFTGHLKIFFSYAENIGKTQIMLHAARTAARQGIDVVIGYIAPHNHEQLSSLELIPPCQNGAFDLDAALLRHPQLILIDELAHTNEESCRHKKRFQDVQELLAAGIDVYTTVNVSNIESLHDTVASITGLTRWDRIPDSVFDNADQVELIDIEPQELIERLQQSESADSLLTVEQLTALREIALRRCADRVKVLAARLQSHVEFHTDEHILACLSSSPSNAKIIRTAARMARAFNSQFTALFVETPDFSLSTQQDKKRLLDNQKLARQLGASIETVYGEDVPYQIAEFARLSGITKIVLGRSAFSRQHILGKPPLTEQLLTYIPDMDIHIIPDSTADRHYRPKRIKQNRDPHIIHNAVKTVTILCAATLLGIVFEQLGFTDANIIMVYILGVLATSIVTSHRIYSLLSSVASVFVFNFLFTMPRFSLSAYDTGYPITFITMFLTAYVTGTLAIRYKEQAGQSAKIAHRTKILFDTDQLLSKADGKEQIIHATGQQLHKLFGRNVIIFENQDGVLSKPYLFCEADQHVSAPQKETELAAAQWVLKNNHNAGATTDTLSHAHYLYLALRVNERVYGVVGIEAKNSPPDAFEHGILLSILGECALALENEKNAREKEAAAILAENEQLRANILRTISHDLRTPLTTISGNANNLIHNAHSFDDETRHQLYCDIYEDALWLIDLVENLLYATRIEEGRMTLNTSTESMGEITEVALHHLQRKCVRHPIEMVTENDFLLVRADAKLIVQVIINLVDNAVKYTPEGCPIRITVTRNGNMASLCVADLGCGIADDEKEKIFEKFYSGSHTIADNRRRLGLGLYLCRAIIQAHGGTIHVQDNIPHGSVFTFTLPLEEVHYHE